MSAIALGGIAAVPSYLALQWRAKTSLDDSLDVVAAHGVGGTVGALLTGVFAQKALNGIADGALFGNPGQLGDAGHGRPAAIVYSGVVSFILLKLISLVLPLRATESDEATGPRHQRPRRRGVPALRWRRPQPDDDEGNDAATARRVLCARHEIGNRVNFQLPTSNSQGNLFGSWELVVGS